jgi:hypothetical protein
VGTIGSSLEIGCTHFDSLDDVHDAQRFCTSPATSAIVEPSHAEALVDGGKDLPVASYDAR